MACSSCGKSAPKRNNLPSPSRGNVSSPFSGRVSSGIKIGKSPSSIYGMPKIGKSFTGRSR